MKKLVEQTFVINNKEDEYAVKLIRCVVKNNSSAIEIRDIKGDTSTQVIDLPPDLMRAFVKCLIDSPYIFSEQNK